MDTHGTVLHGDPSPRAAGTSLRPQPATGEELGHCSCFGCARPCARGAGGSAVKWTPVFNAPCFPCSLHGHFHGTVHSWAPPPWAAALTGLLPAPRAPRGQGMLGCEGSCAQTWWVPSWGPHLEPGKTITTQRGPVPCNPVCVPDIPVLPSGPLLLSGQWWPRSAAAEALGRPRSALTPSPGQHD